MTRPEDKLVMMWHGAFYVSWASGTDGFMDVPKQVVAALEAAGIRLDQMDVRMDKTFAEPRKGPMGPRADQ